MIPYKNNPKKLVCIYLEDARDKVREARTSLELVLSYIEEEKDLKEIISYLRKLEKEIENLRRRKCTKNL